MHDMWLLLLLLLPVTVLVLRSREILTKCVIAHPFIIPFFPGSIWAGIRDPLKLF